MRTAKIFIDASVWIAFTVETDSLHVQAKNIFNDLLKQKSIQFYTSDYIIDETATRIKKKKDGSGAKLFLQQLMDVFKKRKIEIIFISKILFDKSVRIFNRYPEPNTFSFTDASIVSVMRHYKIKTLLTFDRDFKKLERKLKIQILP